MGGFCLGKNYNDIAATAYINVEKWVIWYTNSPKPSIYMTPWSPSPDKEPGPLFRPGVKHVSNKYEA